jgi:hypothetical protein
MIISICHLQKKPHKSASNYIKNGNAKELGKEEGMYARSNH